MSFIQMGQSFSNVQEKKPVPKGLYDLRIENAEAHKSKESGKDSIKVTLSIEGHGDAPKVLHYVPLPASDDDEEKVGNKMIMIKRFLEAFGIPYEDNGFAIEDFFGAAANLQLDLTDPDDDPNGNVYNRMFLPRLEDDGSDGGVVAGKKVASKKS